jgi:ACR3 family arsenite efflux pump ArsB
MALIGGAASRIARLEMASRRAVVFTAVTRNSLVVLPLVLALPAAYDLSPLVVVTQTLVELLVMVTMVRVVPKLVR